MSSSSLCSRRALLRAGLGLVAGPLMVACGGDGPAAPSTSMPVPDDAVTIGTDAVLVTVSRIPMLADAFTSEAAVVLMAAQVIVVRTGPTAFRAYSNVCPHSGCGVSVVQTPRLVCPCHGSTFDFAGRRLEGPAPTGLEPLAASFDTETQRLRIERASA